MNILYLGENRADNLCSYYEDYLAMMRQNHLVHCYGPHYPQYDNNDRIEDVLAKAPCRPDLIVVGAPWENDKLTGPFDPHPAIKLGHLDIPRLMFLNKEYKALEQKIAWIESNRIDLVLTAIPSLAATAKAGDARFVHLPIPVNTQTFHPSNIAQDVDFAFVGSLHLQYTAIRWRIREQLVSGSFDPLRICWGDYECGGTLDASDYRNLLPRTRVSLATPSACDVIGTRFFEIMASGSLLLCPESTEYEGLLVPGVHCVTFAADLSNFRSQLLRYLDDDTERTRIVQNALSHVRCHHSIPARALTFNRILVEVMRLTAGPSQAILPTPPPHPQPATQHTSSPAASPTCRT